MPIVRPDGSVHVHRSLLDPSRHQIFGIDRGRFLALVGATLIGGFVCLMGIMMTVDSTFWTAILTCWVIMIAIAVLLMRRIGARGGYFQRIYLRRIREQECYCRSAHSAAPIKRIPDQQR